MTLTDDELDRYARHIVLPQIGGIGQQRLKATRVAIVGAGGIGAAVIPALTGAGIGHLTIIDGDIVELSNLQRQPIYNTGQVGMAKARLADPLVDGAQSPRQPSPASSERIDADNAADLLAGHHLIIDGTDNFATRLVVSDTCVALGIPLISAAAQQFQGQVALFRSTALLSLLRRRCVRRRRLRHLRRTRRARRVDRDGRQLRRLARDPRHHRHRQRLRGHAAPVRRPYA